MLLGRRGELQEGQGSGRVNSRIYRRRETGHAEAVRIEFDPDQITYDELLNIFFRMHDPTTLNRQGPDVGKQYRSAIFYHSDEQRQKALAVKQEIERSGIFKGTVVTEITGAGEFFEAEEYHQKYYLKKGLEGCGSCNQCC
jgi:peptide-methionine (S)-S-oxide reductase